MGDVFSVAAARRAGHTRAARNNRDLISPFRGVRVLPDLNPPSPTAEESFRSAPTLEMMTRMRALTAVMSRHAFFEGPTAALLQRLPVPAPTTKTLYVAVEVGRTPPKWQGKHPVASRKISPRHVVVRRREGLPTLDAPTAWASCGKHLALADLVAMADALLWSEPPPPPGSNRRPKPPRYTRDQLQAVLNRGRWANLQLLRQALALSTHRSASPPESRFRLSMADDGLPAPELNADIFADGVFLANADFVFRQYKVCVEYQSAYHRNARQYEADRRRMDDLRGAGWIPIEVTHLSAEKEPWRGIKEVTQALMSRGWVPPV